MSRAPLLSRPLCRLWPALCGLALAACLADEVSPGESGGTGTPDATMDAGAPATDASSTPAEDAEAEAGDVDAEASALVDPYAWQRLSADDDPFSDRPDAVECTDAATSAGQLGGELVFDVETGLCNYLTVEQPSQKAVSQGQTLKVRLWHFELTADEPAEAHAAVSIDAVPLLDERIAIPQPGELLVREVVAPRDFEAGVPIHFHLHNHGQNSWALVEVSVRP